MGRKFFKGLAILGVLLLFGTSAFTAGLTLGYQNRPAVQKITGVFNKETAQTPAINFSPFWESWQIINESYLPENNETPKITDQEKIWGAISGLVRSLRDPYSTFLTPEQNQTLSEEINGQFGGIGIEIEQKDELVTVVTPLPGTPAQQAGIQPGDIIIEVNGQDILKLKDTVTDIIKLIRGPVGSRVELTILREGRKEPLKFTLLRAIINVPTLETEKQDDVFIIKLYNFGGTAPDLFRQAMHEWRASGLQKIIIDLRGNPGGLLESAVDIASWFLPRGAVIAQEIKSKDSNIKLYRSRGYNGPTAGNKIVVLVDRGSASASEIFAAALSEHNVATVIGEKTFGKGSVQEVISIGDNTALKLTVARWLSPKGLSLSQNGFSPQIIVPLPEEDRVAKRDPQMERALEIVRGESYSRN